MRNELFLASAQVAIRRIVHAINGWRASGALARIIADGTNGIRQAAVCGVKAAQ
jgi:hypothetical protein